jgi:hypothetical protein
MGVLMAMGYGRLEKPPESPRCYGGACWRLLAIIVSWYLKGFIVELSLLSSFFFCCAFPLFPLTFRLFFFFLTLTFPLIFCFLFISVSAFQAFLL